ncbi:MAG: KH domain-containing protein [Bacilli bacterium]|nr:KH domain-containing protein [Bacilli bacterium]
MNAVKKSAKSKEEALNLVLAELNANEAEVVYSYEEIKGGLFKGTTYECTGFLKLDVIADVEEYLKKVLNGMGVEVNFEVTTKDNTTTIKMYSSQNPILIGKDGKNLEALTTIVRQYVKNITFNGPRIVLDVEDYKDRQLKKIERLAKNLAREVVKTKIDVEMDDMNSYERRIVHNVLTEFKGVTTESVGEEPNRHIVIKYKGE